MSRVWLEDRAGHSEYRDQVTAAKAARRAVPGRWRVRWYDDQNKMKAKTFARQPQATAYRAELEQQFSQGSYRDPAAGKALLRDVAETWLAGQQHVKRTTRAQYRETLEATVVPRWGNQQVGRIRHDDVVSWVSEMSESLAPATVKANYIVFSGVMSWAVTTDRIAASPCTGVKLPRIERDEHVYLGHAEVEALADAAGPDRPLILTLSYTGIRFGEASALAVGRVDLAKLTARISQAYADLDGELVLGSPKSGKARTVPLAPFLADELRPLMEDRPADALLFTAPRGGPHRLHNWRMRVFGPAVKAAELDGRGLTPHKLRHTAASLAIAAGADILTLQTMLGHKSASMTLDVYGHLMPDRLGEVGAALDDARTKAMCTKYVLGARSPPSETAVNSL